VVPDILKENDDFIFKWKQSFFLDSLPLKMKASWSFKTSATTHSMTWCHIPQDLNPQKIYLNFSFPMLPSHIKTGFENPKKLTVVLQKYLYEKSFYSLDEFFKQKKKKKLHITWIEIEKTWHACINLFVYITRWRFKSLFVMQRANFLVVKTFKRLVHNATTISFHNNLSPTLYSILLYFIILNNLYCTATSKNCIESCDCCTFCVGLTSWVLKMWWFPYPWIL
jgi:hypothetical protein